MKFTTGTKSYGRPESDENQRPHCVMDGNAPPWSLFLVGIALVVSAAALGGLREQERYKIDGWRGHLQPSRACSLLLVDSEMPLIMIASVPKNSSSRYAFAGLFARFKISSNRQQLIRVPVTLARPPFLTLSCGGTCSPPLLAPTKTVQFIVWLWLLCILPSHNRRLLEDLSSTGC
jgi:hypothetical protein